MKDNKELNNIQKLKNRRIFGEAGYLSQSSSRPNHKRNVYVQFPVLDKQQSLFQLYPRSILDYQPWKKANNRQLKNQLKSFQEQKRKNDEDCMRMLGLDIKKISVLEQKKSLDSPSNKKKNNRNGQRHSPVEKLRLGSRTLLMRTSTQQQNEQARQQQFISNHTQHISNQIFHSAQWKKDQSPPYPIRKVKKYLYEKMASISPTKRQIQLNLIYQKRIMSYSDLLWKVAYSHNYHLCVNLEQQTVKNIKYKAYVGIGNNSNLIKSLLKRRFWWAITQDSKQQGINFVWTQIKVNSLIDSQSKTQMKKPIYLLNQQQQLTSHSQRKTKSSFKLRKHSQKKFLTSQLFNYKIFNELDGQCYKKYYEKYEKDKFDKPQLTLRKEKLEKKLPQYVVSKMTVMHNHLENNFYLGNKKAMFHNMRQYYSLMHSNVYEYLPLTFHIKKGIKDIEYKKFVSYYEKRKIIMKKQQKLEEDEGIMPHKTRNIWIVKPGQNSNRGRGITVIDEVYQLNQIMKETEKDTDKTYIVQLYIDRPLLYNNRKFDIRHYMLLTNLHGVTRAYWYEQGYIRTSSYQFNIGNFDPEIHLTNDAIQKQYPQYGRYQPGNKLSYAQFQRYLDTNYREKKYNFKRQILPIMKKIASDSARSVFTKIAPKNQMHNFQLLGFDFMIDKNFKPWLIQINTNPCLQTSCPLLDKIIPYAVEHSFKLTLDVIFPPPSHYPNNYKHLAPYIDLQTFKYQLIFDSQIEGQSLKSIYKKVKGNLIEQIGEISDDQQFKDEGKEIKLQDFA